MTTSEASSHLAPGRGRISFGLVLGAALILASCSKHKPKDYTVRYIPDDVQAAYEKNFDLGSKYMHAVFAKDKAAISEMRGNIPSLAVEYTISDYTLERNMFTALIYLGATDYGGDKNKAYLQLLLEFPSKKERDREMEITMVQVFSNGHWYIGEVTHTGN